MLYGGDGGSGVGTGPHQKDIRRTGINSVFAWCCDTSIYYLHAYSMACLSMAMAFYFFRAGTCVLPKKSSSLRVQQQNGNNAIAQLLGDFVSDFFFLLRNCFRWYA